MTTLLIVLLIAATSVCCYQLGKSKAEKARFDEMQNALNVRNNISDDDIERMREKYTR
jgi:hypothetical protein